MPGIRYERQRGVGKSCLVLFGDLRFDVSAALYAIVSLSWLHLGVCFGYSGLKGADYHHGDQREDEEHQQNHGATLQRADDCLINLEHPSDRCELNDFSVGLHRCQVLFKVPDRVKPRYVPK
jgi:hypothetical protein